MLIYYEKEALDYELGSQLKVKFADLSWIEIENHNNIPELRQNPNSEFARMKENIVIGVRKTHKYVPNHKISDFLVPYTSSGCSAMCLYCYLVCNYNKCSYLRLFVNREEMLNKLIKTAAKTSAVFEIGSNSDLILENTITDNLGWTIENFAKEEKGYITFPTKFDMVEPLLNLEHKGRTLIRMSLNPEDIIKKTEFKTATLEKRIRAINALKSAGYKVGILIAPVIMLDGWESMYKELVERISIQLSNEVKKDLVFEVIFMTYSYVHRMINKDAFKNAVDLYDKEKMTGRGRGKYMYRPEIKENAQKYMRTLIENYFPGNVISYIV